MSDINKRILEAAAALAKAKAEKCPECYGEGEIQGCSGSFSDDTITGHYTTCIACVTLRGIAEECWHKPELSVPHHPDKSRLNPAYTVQSLRGLLEALGEWVSFKWYLFYKKGIGQPFDIITSDLHMQVVVAEYLEQKPRRTNERA